MKIILDCEYIIPEYCIYNRVHIIVLNKYYVEDKKYKSAVRDPVAKGFQIEWHSSSGLFPR